MDCSPKALIDLVRCNDGCVPPGAMKSVQIASACSWANAGGTPTPPPMPIPPPPAPLAAPSNVVLPVITGTAQQGQALWGSNGTWAATLTGYTYRCRANGVAIGGAT